MQAKESNKASVYLNWVTRRLVIMLFDILIVNLSYFLALVIRFYANNQFSATAQGYVPAFWAYAPYHTITCIVVFACFKLYNNRWKNAGWNDIHALLSANIVTGVLHVAGTLLFVMRMPITYYVLGAILQFAMMTAIRFSYRLFVMESIRLKNYKRSRINVMLVGTGEMAQVLRSQIEKDAENSVRPVCVFSHGAVHAGELMNGIPVVSGMNRLEEYIGRYQIKCVILADPLVPAAIRKQIREICQKKEIEVQDYTGYMVRESVGFTPMKLLEYVTGPVDIVANGLKASFASSEEAMAKLDGNFSVQQIYTKNGRMVIVLAKETVVLNDIRKDWVKDVEEETGKEISFF